MAVTTAFPGGLVAPQQWLDGLLPKLPGVSIDAIKHEVLTVARDFFDLGQVWTEWCGPILLHPGVAEYQIETGDTKAESCGVLRAIVVETGLDLSPADLRSAGLRAASPLLDETSEDGPTCYWCPTQQTISFWPLIKDGTDRMISVFLWLKPIDLNIPMHLISTHYDAICNGVLGRMYLVPGLTFKPDLAKFHSKRYVADRSAARFRAERSYTGQTRVARPPAPLARGSYRGRPA